MMGTRSVKVMHFATVLLCLTTFSNGDGYFGCLYNKNICSNNMEWCFNDYAYGKCIHIYSDLSNENMYRYDMETGYFRQLNEDLNSLFDIGFEWQDDFVQCHIQQHLNSIRYKQQLDDKLCFPFLTDALNKYLDSDPINEDNDDNDDNDVNDNSMMRNGDDLGTVTDNLVFLPSYRNNIDLNSELDRMIDSIPKTDEPHLNLLLNNKTLSAALSYFMNMSRVINELRTLPLQKHQIENLIKNNNYQQLIIFLNDYRIRNGKAIDNLNVGGVSSNANKVNRLSHTEDNNKTNIIFTESGPIYLEKLTKKIYIKDYNKNATNSDHIDNVNVTSTKIQSRAFAGVLEMIPKNVGHQTNYGFMQFNQNLLSWNQGYDILKRIITVLKLNPSTFSHIKVHDNEVEFRIARNLLKMNTSEFVNKIESMKQDLKNKFGLQLDSVQIRPQEIITSHVAYAEDNNSDLLITIAIIGVCSSIVFSIAILFAIKKKIGGQKMFAANIFDPTEDACGKISTSYQNLDDCTSAAENFNSNVWNDETGTIDIDAPTGHMILAYIENYLKNDDKLEREWSNLQNFVAEKNSTRVASSSENVKKNRYKKFVPYDHTRIVLNKVHNPTGNDYINASGICDHDFRNPDYIATQGPLVDTGLDFWQLIWEKHITVIVMLSKLTENNKSMCSRYWPDDGSQVFHVYEVHLVSEHIWCDDYLVRSFYLKNRQTGETRTISQFHFISWPENGIPSSTKVFLEYRRKIHKVQQVKKNPILVHCNDGSGRTGTFILIDLVLNRVIKGAKEIDIAATLEHLREQRCGMVATKEQFQFVLMALSDEIRTILKTLTPPPPIVPVEEGGQKSK